MSPLETFFANLKRLFESRTRPPAQTMGQPTADRPPPSEPAFSPAAAFPDVVPTVDDVSHDVSEVRALLEAAAEAPVPASESDAQVPPPALEPAPTFPTVPTPSFPPPVDQEAVDVPSAAPDRVGDALMLTLATPVTTFTIARSSATLGRGQENTVRLDDLSVSRRHARIAYRQGGYWLSDLGSMGGTWVDGTRLNAPRRIAAGEVIDIGLCRLTVSFADDAVIAGTKKSASKPRSAMADEVRRRR